MTSVGRSSRVERRVAPFEQVVAQAARLRRSCARAGAGDRSGAHRVTVRGVWRIGCRRGDKRGRLREARARLRGPMTESVPCLQTLHARRVPSDVVAIRAAEPRDVDAIVRLIRGLAEFEKLTHLLQVTPESLAPHLFGDRPVAEALVAERAGRRRRVRALLHQLLDLPGPARASTSRTCSSSRTQRGRGIGQALLEHLARLAATRGCGRFEWSVLDWNEGAIRFYQRMGATVMPDWRICRIAGPALGRRSPIRPRALMRVDRYAELHAGFRWHVPADFNIAEVCCTRWARERARRGRDPLRARGRQRAPTSPTASSTATPTGSPRRCAGSASAAATASRSSCRSASRPRSRTSRSTGSARSRCRCRCCSGPTRSSTASTTARRASRSSTRAASPTCSRRGRSARSSRR